MRFLRMAATCLQLIFLSTNNPVLGFFGAFIAILLAAMIIAVFLVGILTVYTILITRLFFHTNG